MSGKVLVTGASGLVGANLTRALIEKGRKVLALVHNDRKALEGMEVETIQADVRNLDELSRAVEEVEVVYHLAGSISLSMEPGLEMIETNVLGTRNVVSACLRYGVKRLIHFSSIDALCQAPLDQPVDESRALLDTESTRTAADHIPPYDLAKAQGERVVMAGIEQGLNAVIIRPTAMLGPYDFKPSYLGQAIIKLANGRIPALVNSGFDWVDVRDVVAGAMRAEEAASAGECFMLSGTWHTIRELAEVVAGLTNQAAPIITVPMWLADAFAPAMMNLARFNGKEPIYTRVTLSALRGNRKVSSDRAKRELGYTTRPFRETVQDTLNWFRENNYLDGKDP